MSDIRVLEQSLAPRWTYTVPPNIDHVYLLRTVQRKLVVGKWQGLVGEQYIAWAWRPLEDKRLEKWMIANGQIRP